MDNPFAMSKTLKAERLLRAEVEKQRDEIQSAGLRLAEEWVKLKTYHIFRFPRLSARWDISVIKTKLEDAGLDVYDVQTDADVISVLVEHGLSTAQLTTLELLMEKPDIGVESREGRLLVAHLNVDRKHLQRVLREAQASIIVEPVGHDRKMAVWMRREPDADDLSQLMQKMFRVWEVE